MRWLEGELQQHWGVLEAELSKNWNTLMNSLVLQKGRRVNACRFWNETRLVGCQPNKTRVLKSLKCIKGKKGTEVCGGINEGFITKTREGQVLFVWDEKWKDWGYCKWMHGRSKSILFCQCLRTAAWCLLWLLLATKASRCDRSKAILISTFTVIYI